MNLGLVRLITLACTAYLLSQFYRSSVGVLAPDLMSRLSLTPEELGRLGGIFFLAFACAQLPLGVLLDRYGPRKTTSLVLVGAALGAFLFATFTEFSGLLAGRALMGAGCSVGLMGSLVLFSRWVPSRRFATMAGLVLGVGGFGGILATTPLAAASAWVGWQGVFIGMGAITLVVAMVFWLTVRDTPDGTPFQKTRIGGREDNVLRGFLEILTTRDLWFMLPISFVGYGGLLAILGLWGAPYLKDVQGLGDIDRGNVLLATAAAWNVGCILFGRADRLFDTRKWTAVAGCCGLAMVISVIAVVPPVPLWINLVLFGVLGLVGAFSVLLLAHYRALFPVRLVGRALTFTNFFNFGGVFVLQWTTGLVLSSRGGTASGAPPEAYTTAFLMIAVVLALATFAYLFARDYRPSAEIPG